MTGVGGLVDMEERSSELTWTLHEGILASPFKPPATPSNLAAVVVPTIADKFGARTFILELTYMKICYNRVSL